MSTYDTDQTPNEEIDAAADAAAELSDDQLEDVAGGQSGDWWADDSAIWNG